MKHLLHTNFPTKGARASRPLISGSAAGETPTLPSPPKFVPSLSSHRRCILPTTLAALLLSLAAYPCHARDVATLFEPAERLLIDRIDADRGGHLRSTPHGLIFRGPGLDGTCTFVIHAKDGSWDLSAWNHLRIDFHNTGNHLARVVARIDNPKADSAYNSMAGTAIIPAGEKGTLGFSFTRPGNEYDGPSVFRGQDAKPNGHRIHWRSFNPANVTAIRLTITAAGPFTLRVTPPAVCWPYGSAANADLEALPYLDRFGQNRNLQWPGKLGSIEELQSALAAETADAKSSTPPDRNRFGGWTAGPKSEPTGYFHTRKIDGRWWLIDPEGAPFWSHGANSVGVNATTPANPPRHELFEWLPENSDPLHAVIMVHPGRNRPIAANFLAGNLAQALGHDHEAKARNLNHNRLRSWGVNTLGAWSDADMIREARTPYTRIVANWSANLVPGGKHLLPDPFDPRFEAGLRRALERLAPHREDPWCIGIFIDNEIDWPTSLSSHLFAAHPDRPAKSALCDHLKAKYTDIAGLNRAWGTNLESFHALAALREPPTMLKAKSGVFWDDINAFYAILADRYYATCKRLMRELMPNHLYLGSRIHRAPAFVIEAAARHVDVFSGNEYSEAGGSRKLPAHLDIPYLTGEFHFGAPDRGVPGAGLFGVHDQNQRALAYLAYLSASLLDPRVVGSHWFAFPDQSAAGRPGENYQIGMIDITGRAYPEFTTAVRRLSNHLYPLRANPPPSIEAALEAILAD